MIANGEENGVLKNDLRETTEVFNKYYINIVETISGMRPSSPAILIPSMKVGKQ